MTKSLLLHLFLLSIGISATTYGEPGRPIPETISEVVVKKCGMTKEEKEKIESCLRTYNENNCYILPMDPEVQQRLVTCSLNEIQQEAFSITGKGPSDGEIEKYAKNECAKSFGKSPAEILAKGSAGSLNSYERQRRREWESCVSTMSFDLNRLNARSTKAAQVFAGCPGGVAQSLKEFFKFVATPVTATISSTVSGLAHGIENVVRRKELASERCEDKLKTREEDLRKAVEGTSLASAQRKQYREFQDCVSRESFEIAKAESLKKAPEDPQTKLAKERCEQSLAGKENEILKDIENTTLGSPQRQRYRSWENCVSREKFEIQKSGLVINNAIGKATYEAVTLLKCLRPGEQAEVACSAATDILSGGVIAKGAKATVSAAIWAGKHGSEVTKTAAALSKYAQNSREVFSSAHVGDITNMVENPNFRAAISKTGANAKDLKMAMQASDAGKNMAYWKDLMGNPERAKAFIDILTSKDKNSPSGKAFQKMLKENGFEGKSILNPDISVEEYAQIFQKVGMMSTGYQHELAGLAIAFEAFNGTAPAAFRHVKIADEAQFLRQVTGNLGHNTWTSGFGEIFSKIIIPNNPYGLQLIEKMFPGKGKNYFKNTIFEGETNAAGFIVPKAQFPFDVHGYIHTVGDRVSQATRGGKIKINEEMGGPILADPKTTNTALMKEIKTADGKESGLNNLFESMIGNQEKTIVQFNDNLAQIRRTPNFTQTQKSALSDLHEAYIQRIEKQLEFDKARIKRIPAEGPIEAIEFDVNGKVERITGNSTIAQTRAQINRLADAEEAVHGNPVLGAGRSPIQPLGPSKGLAAFGEGLVPVTAKELIKPGPLTSIEYPSNYICPGVIPKSTAEAVDSAK